MYTKVGNVIKLHNFLNVYYISRKVVSKVTTPGKKWRLVIESMTAKIWRARSRTEDRDFKLLREMLFMKKSGFLDSHPSFLRNALYSWIASFILLWFLLSWFWILKEIWIFSLQKYSRCLPITNTWLATWCCAGTIFLNSQYIGVKC